MERSGGLGHLVLTAAISFEPGSGRPMSVGHRVGGLDIIMNDGKHSLPTAVWRGICGRCPKCGKGGLFLSYLKQVDECAACGNPWRDIRADDAPPWLTIMIVGHLMAPLILNMVRNETLPYWLTVTSLLSLALVLCLLILPRAKGLFIAVIWALRVPS